MIEVALPEFPHQRMDRTLSKCSRKDIHFGQPIGSNDPVLGQVTAQRIHQLRSLPHQQIPGAKEHRLCLLVFALQRHEALRVGRPPR